MRKQRDVFNMMCLWKKVDRLNSVDLVVSVQHTQIMGLAQRIAAKVNDPFRSNP